MTLLERIRRNDPEYARLIAEGDTEATCQGCEACGFGSTYPCPSQTPVWHAAHLPEWRRRLVARDQTGWITSDQGTVL